MKKLSEVIDNESKWCKQWFATRSDGSRTHVEDPEACKFCLVGALSQTVEVRPMIFIGSSVHYDETSMLRQVILDLIADGQLNHPRSAFFWRVADFNDHPDTTFSDIQKVIAEYERRQQHESL